MTKVVFQITPKTYQEMWQVDKGLLKPVMKVDGDLPTNEEVFKILVRRQEGWQNPAEPFVLTQESLEVSLSRMKEDLKSVWGEEIPEMPSIEIHGSEDYLPRLQEIDTQMKEKFGYGPIIQSPPTMGLYPFFRKLILPRKFIVRYPRTAGVTSLGSSDFDNLEYDWDKSFFEEAFFGELSCALIRQERGEWGEDYVRTFKKLGSVKESSVSMLNDVSVQFSRERIANERGWNLYVVGEKIGSVWNNVRRAEAYKAIDALSKKARLVDVCKADEFHTTDTEVSATFYLQHPSFRRKYKDFCENVRGK